MRALPLLGVSLLLLAGCGGEGPQQAGGSGIAPLDSAQELPQQARRVEEARQELTRLNLAALDLGPLAGAEGEEATVSYQGDAPRRFAEPDAPLRRTSPAVLLEDALAALGRRDLSALARLSRHPAEHPWLTEDDASDAERRFLGPATSRYWAKVGEAIRTGRYEVVSTPEAARAVVRVEVGGAAGDYRIELRKESDGWYLAS